MGDKNYSKLGLGVFKVKKRDLSSDLPNDKDENDKLKSINTSSERKFLCLSLTSSESSNSSSRNPTNDKPVPILNLNQYEASASVNVESVIIGQAESSGNSIQVNSPLEVFLQDQPTIEKSLNVLEGKSFNKRGLVCVKEGCYVLAKKYFKMGACVDNKAACYNAGLCYHLGRGVESNVDKAAIYYDRAATARALYNLALLILSGQLKKFDERFVEANGIKCLEAAAQRGLAAAQNDLAVIYTESGKYEDAVNWFTLAAKQQHVNALYHLGVCNERGYGIQVNYPQAAELYGRASRQNHPGAQHNLAVFFEHGMGGLPESTKDALSWYKKSKCNGNSVAAASIDRLLLANRDAKMEEVEFNEDMHLMNDKDINAVPSSACESTVGEQFDSGSSM